MDAETAAKVAKARELLREDPRLTQRQLADKVGLSQSTISDRLKESLPDDSAEASPQSVSRGRNGEVTVEGVGDAEALLTEAGYDPAEYQVVRVRVGLWGDPESPMRQHRIEAIPRSVIDLAPEALAPVAPPTAPESGDRSILIVGDSHAPHYDEGLHHAICSYLADEQPALVVDLGDAGDYASVSRHRDTLGFAQGVKDCNRGVYTRWHDYREANPEGHLIALPGNHDDRVEHYVHDRAPEVWQVGPAFQEDLPSLDLKRMWRTEELGVNLLDGDWERTKFEITPSLTARHGYMTAEGTPQKMLNKHSKSQVQGHSHRLRFTYKTKHDPIDVRLAVEAGCACKIEEGLGYAAEPDWQQGGVVGHIWDDGDFSLAPAPYIGGRWLLPDGRRYRA